MLRLLTETVLQYSALMMSSRRGYSINVSCNTYGCHKLISFFHFIFSILLSFYSYEKQLFRNFLKFAENHLREIAWWSLCLLMLPFSSPTRTFFWQFFEIFRTSCQQSNCEQLPQSSLIFFHEIFRSFIFAYLKQFASHMQFVKN